MAVDTAPLLTRKRNVAFKTETTSADSRRTPTTWNRWWSALRTGLTTRYHSTSSPTNPYSADQANRAFRLPANESPSAKRRWPGLASPRSAP